MTELQRIIEDAFERRAELDPATAPTELREAVEETLGLLEWARRGSRNPGMAPGWSIPG